MSLRLLVVDDQEDIRLMLQILLEDEGWETELAASGEEALGRSDQATRFDAVVVDYRMPGLDGMQVARKFREAGFRGTIIICSAYLNPQMEREAGTLAAETASKSDLQGLVEKLRRSENSGRPEDPSDAKMQGHAMREGEFLSIVSHELKTPIAVITGLAHTLSERRHSLTEEQIDHCLDRISRQGDRLARLVADLLDLSQVESGRFRLSLEPVYLAATAERALDDAPSPPDKSVELHIPESLCAVADQSRLEQVLVNLLTNAYRYGGSCIRLEARGTPAGVLVTVADDGEGVPDELVPKLFERFVRGASGDGVEGSGLGLAIARALVDGFGGRIWYEPGEPAGARFRFLVREVETT
jgi:two-component system, sensor histidine kinase and response regulator